MGCGQSKSLNKTTGDDPDSNDVYQKSTKTLGNSFFAMCNAFTVVEVSHVLRLELFGFCYVLLIYPTKGQENIFEKLFECSEVKIIIVSML